MSGLRPSARPRPLSEPPSVAFGSSGTFSPSPRVRPVIQSIVVFDHSGLADFDNGESDPWNQVLSATPVADHFDTRRNERLRVDGSESSWRNQ